MGRAETGHGAGWRHKLIMCLKIDNHYRVGFVEMGGWTEAAHYIIISVSTQGDQYLCPPPSSGLPGKESISKYNVPPCTCPDYRTGMYSVACYRNDVGTDVGISGPTPSEKYYGDGN